METRVITARALRPPPLRILYLLVGLDVGGTERQVTDLVLALDRTRFEPRVCCLGTGGPLESLLREADVPVEVVGLRRPRSFVHGLGAAPALTRGLVRLWRLVTRYRPTIAHSFLYWSYTVGACVARAAGVPVILASRRNLGHPQAHRPAHRALSWLGNRASDLVIVNSEAVRRHTLDTGGVAPERVVVIPNGVDLQRFAGRADPSLRRSLGLDGGAPLVGVTANLLDYKGHGYFLDAWRELRGAYPNAQAILIGDGPCRSELQDRIRALDLGESVRLLGSRTDVPALLALVDLVAHPSLEEGFPNAVLEGMAAGKPVVATAVGGTPEAIVDGGTGLLVPPRDSGTLAKAIARILSSPAEARALGEAGRRRVAERFDLQTMVRRHEALYERLGRASTPP
jgi:glycosyltransferase involved in cell wall biosynthesis